MLNRVEIIGRVGKEAEFRTMNNGKEVCNLSVAVTEKWSDKATGEKKEKTEWTKWVCFNENLNKIIRFYVNKGDLIRLVGSLQTRSYEQDGVKKYSTECVIQGFGGELTLLPNAKQQSNDDGYRGSSNNNVPAPADDLDTDSIPF